MGGHRAGQHEVTGSLVRHKGFARFWAADTVSLAGTHITTLALKAVAVLTLGASATGAGLLEAARRLPYLLFGLVAGALVDRRRRLPVLVGADLARAVVLALIPLAAFTGTLGMPLLIALVVVFGTLSVFYDAAHQSFLPLLVPTGRLTDANARLEQTRSAAQGFGPLVGGALVKLVGGPLAVLVDAASYLVSGLVLATLRTPERRSRPRCDAICGARSVKGCGGSTGTRCSGRSPARRTRGSSSRPWSAACTPCWCWTSWASTRSSSA